MSSPRIIVQIFISGSKALGRAFYEAGRQAVKNAKSSPHAAMSNDAAGVGNATSGSITDQLTRQHRMTLDEAQLILNVKKDTSVEQVLKNYEHLFKSNSPLPKPEKPISSKEGPQPTYSHYLQSKVFRAHERWEAEMKQAPLKSPPEPSSPSSN